MAFCTSGVVILQVCQSVANTVAIFSGVYRELYAYVQGSPRSFSGVPISVEYPNFGIDISGSRW
jgi:hypothetical protein